MVATCPARLTVLVVDDFEDSRIMLKRMLEMSNYCVLDAADGREAVEMVRQSCPDLLLMDVHMPKLDGLAATRQIRECQDRCRDVTILALTAYDTCDMKEAALEAGCNGYITKPIDFDELDKVLRQYLLGW